MKKMSLFSFFFLLAKVKKKKSLDFLLSIYIYIYCATVDQAGCVLSSDEGNWTCGSRLDWTRWAWFKCGQTKLLQSSSKYWIEATLFIHVLNSKFLVSDTEYRKP